MRVTKTGKRGIDLIKSSESFRSEPYLCSAGIPTIGYGSTYYEDGTRVRLTDKPITEPEALALFSLTLKKYETAVDSFTVDTINQQQFDALTSLCYNIGENALRKSSLIKMVNENPNNPLIADKFKEWCNAGGRKVSGLVTRRLKESQLYFDKAY